jgi:hypothetical protein
MLRILEAMGILALVTRHTPKDTADERERIQEMLDLHLQFPDESQQSGVPDTVAGLQATTAAMGNVQKQLSGVLREFTDRDSGVAARVESANRHVLHSLEHRTKALDELMHEFKTDLLRIWIPLATSATLLIGLFVGMEIQGCRDAGSATVDQSPMSSSTPSAPTSVEAPRLKAYGHRTNGSSSKRDQHVGKQFLIENAPWSTPQSERLG